MTTGSSYFLLAQAVVNCDYITQGKWYRAQEVHGAFKIIDDDGETITVYRNETGDEPKVRCKHINGTWILVKSI